MNIKRALPQFLRRCGPHLCSSWAIVVLLFSVVTFPVLAQPNPAPLTGSISSHDPSRAVYSDGFYYIYSTGGGMKYSSNLLQWTSGPSPFPSGVPAWTKAFMSSNQGLWAPDVIFYKGQYFLYYSVASGDGANTVIGVMTSPSLNPSSPNYKWTDHELVISCPKSERRAAIDPAPFIDAAGNLWLSFGSGYIFSSTDPTIFLMQVNPNTGLRISPNSTLYPVENGHIEASFVQYHNGYYYLFWNDGGCCNGASSTYRIHVARSASITGPYVNKAGAVGNEIFLASHGSIHGPGHIGILNEPGVDYFTYHYYPDTGFSVIGLQILLWGSDGWPSPGPGTVSVAKTYQAESAVISGGVTIDSNNDGFNGTGYANFPTNGGTLTFNNVSGNGGGTKSITIRYSLGKPQARTGSLTVNGVTTYITFQPTSSFTTWDTMNVNVTLTNSSNNTIRFSSTGSDLANIDEIVVP